MKCQKCENDYKEVFIIQQCIEGIDIHASVPFIYCKYCIMDWMEHEKKRFLK